MNPNDFNDLLTFPLAPPSGWGQESMNKNDKYLHMSSKQLLKSNYKKPEQRKSSIKHKSKEGVEQIKSTEKITHKIQGNFNRFEQNGLNACYMNWVMGVVVEIIG